jgi:hypothetical protein
MSQFFKDISGSPIVATSYLTDSGSAVPAGNILNVVTPGGGTQGIMTLGSGNTITIELTGGSFGTATTVGATTATLLTIPMPDNSAMTLDVLLAGFESTLPGAVGSSLTASFIRTGAGVPTIVQLPDDQQNISASLSAVSYSITGSGANILVTVTGQAGVTINWRGTARTVVAP